MTDRRCAHFLERVRIIGLGAGGAAMGRDVYGYLDDAVSSRRSTRS